jgi:CO/xanthine dehydrogenase FAD-binding subunit
MKPARFAYRRAGSIGEALTWLADEASESKILAGGQSLVPLLNMRLARPAVLVDVNSIRELGAIDVDDGALRLGATVRHSDLIESALVSERAPLLTAAARHIGHRAIRNLGTLGGSLAHADPAAELPATLVALGGAVVVASQDSGLRTVAAEDLGVGPFLTSVQPTELLCEVRVPDQRGWAWGFAEAARRPGDFALAGVAGMVRFDAGGVCQSTRLVAFGVGDGPVRLGWAERLLLGQPIEAQIARVVGAAAAEGLPPPPTDVHASSAYRQHLISVLTEQVLLEARSRAA